MEGSEDTELVLYICIGGVAPGVPPVLLIVTMAAVVFSLSPGLSGLIIEMDIRPQCTITFFASNGFSLSSCNSKRVLTVFFNF